MDKTKSEKLESFPFSEIVKHLSEVILDVTSIDYSIKLET